MGDHIWLGDHIVPFIDHAAHMRNDHFHFIEIEVETEIEPIEVTPYSIIIYRGMGVQITNGRGSYSVSQVQARVTTTPLDCAIVFGTYCIRWKEWTEKVYRAGGAPKSNQ